MTKLFSEETWIVLGILSVVFFVVSLIAIPILLVRLPVDYFDDDRPRGWLRTHHPAIRIATHLLKNLLGAMFLLAGIAMIVLPGQGILTILLGISLLDFPGKKQLERRLLGRPAVLRTINAIRAKFGKPPLVVPLSAP